jgi:hypothetical protein
MRQFEKYMEHFGDVPGWFEKPSVALWDALLARQTERGLNGLLMEVGVWEGKSAALMALHCTETESCMFLDIRAMDGAKSRIEQVVPEAKCVFMQKNSRSVLQQPSILEMADRVRWMHIDGEHTAEAVMCDL